MPFETKQNQYLEDIKQANADLQKGEIDPNHYFGNLSTAGKFGTVAGLILGGIGAGLSGGKNVALETLNGLITRDIEAQKANINSKTSLLGAYYNQYRNIDVAHKLAKANNVPDLSLLDLTHEKFQA